MTESVDEFRWITSKSTSTDNDVDDAAAAADDAGGDDEVNTGNEVGDNHDDDTIQYDNTTLSHITRQQQQQIEEKRTSPSSVVPRHVPSVISCCSTNYDHHHYHHLSSNTDTSNTNNNSTTVLSIPTLRGVKTSITTPPTTTATNLDSATATANAATTPTATPKPFFIMDFLEDIDSTSLKLVQQILQQQKEGCHPLSSSSLSQRGEDVPSQINRPTTTTTCLSLRPSVAKNQNYYKNNKNDDDDCDEDYWTNDNQFIPLPEYSCTTTTIVAAAPTTSNTYFLQRSWDIARQFHHRGMQAGQTGDWHRAVRYWLDALDIYDQIVLLHHPHDNFNNNHDGNATTTMVSDTYHNIGIAYGKLDQYTDALPYLLKALEIRIDSVTADDDDDDWNATNDGSDATTSTTTKTTEVSPTPQQKQLHRDIAASLYAIGHIYQQQNELSMAICYFSKCQFVLDELSYPGRHYDMARTCIAMGQAYATGHAYSDAVQAFTDAIRLLDQIMVVNHHDDDDDDDHDININSTMLYQAEYQSTLDHLRMMEQMMMMKLDSSEQL